MKRVIRIVILIAALPIVGACGFKFIEGWSVLDAIYMALTTITTVGFGEVHPLSPGGRVFTMVYILFGLGTFSYGLLALVEQAYGGGLLDWLARRRMRNTLTAMNHHFIVCGYGRMGRAVCRLLEEQGKPFVVIDKSESRLAECRDQGWPWLSGDVTADETLKAAGIDRCLGLAAVLGDDAENVYLVLTARLLAPQLHIIARASDETTVNKLSKAGATKVVGLHETGGSRMAQLLVSPHLDQLIQIFQTKGLQLELAEINVPIGAAYAGKTLDQTDLLQRGVTVVAVRRTGGDLIFPLDRSTRFQSGDQLIALGRPDAINAVLSN